MTSMLCTLAFVKLTGVPPPHLLWRQSRCCVFRENMFAAHFATLSLIHFNSSRICLDFRYILGKATRMNRTIGNVILKLWNYISLPSSSSPLQYILDSIISEWVISQVMKHPFELTVAICWFIVGFYNTISERDWRKIIVHMLQIRFQPIRIKKLTRM